MSETTVQYGSGNTPITVRVYPAINDDFNDKYHCWIPSLGERKSEEPNVVFGAYVKLHGTLLDSAAQKYVEAHYFKGSFEMKPKDSFHRVLVHVEAAKGYESYQTIVMEVRRTTEVNVGVYERILTGEDEDE